MHTLQAMIEGIGVHMMRGSEQDYARFSAALNTLSREIGDPSSTLALCDVASRTVEILRTYGQSTTNYFCLQNHQMQSMIAMLTETVAEISGHSNDSISRLQEVEREIEAASGLDDMRAITARLERCLVAVREAVAEQKRMVAGTVARLKRCVQETGAPSSAETEFDRIPEARPDMTELSLFPYVSVFQLHHSDRIASRFGESARLEMLTLIHRALKSVLGPGDRILRRNQTAFVLFLDSDASINVVRTRLALAVARIRQNHIELGKNSALLAIVVDWTLFAQSHYLNLGAALAAVDSFLQSGLLTQPGSPRKE
jgi:hypothetical protein